MTLTTGPSIWIESVVDDINKTHRRRRIALAQKRVTSPFDSRFWRDYNRDETLIDLPSSKTWPDPSNPTDIFLPQDDGLLPPPMWLRPNDPSSNLRAIQRWGQALVQPRHPWSESSRLVCVSGAYNLQSTILANVSPTEADLSGGFRLATHHIQPSTHIAFRSTDGSEASDQEVLKRMQRNRFTFFAQGFSSDDDDNEQIWSGVLMDTTSGRLFFYDNRWKDGNAEDRLVEIVEWIKRIFGYTTSETQSCIQRQVGVLDVEQIDRPWTSGIMMLDWIRHFNNVGNLSGPRSTVDDTLTSWLWHISAEFNATPSTSRRNDCVLRTVDGTLRPPPLEHTMDDSPTWELFNDLYQQHKDEYEKSINVLGSGSTTDHNQPLSRMTIWTPALQSQVVEELKAADMWHKPYSYDQHHARPSSKLTRSPYLTDDCHETSQFAHATREPFGRVNGLPTHSNLYEAQRLLHRRDFLSIDHLFTLSHLVTRDAHCRVWFHPLGSVSWVTDREEGDEIDVSGIPYEEVRRLMMSDVVVLFQQVRKSHFVCLLINQCNGKVYYADSSFNRSSNQDFANAIKDMSEWYRKLGAHEQMIKILQQRARIVNAAQQADGFSCGLSCVEFVRSFVMEGFLDTRASKAHAMDRIFYPSNPTPLVPRYISWITAELSPQESIYGNSLLPINAL